MQATDLAPDDHAVLAEARRVADTLYLEGVHTVASAVRTRSGAMFAGINIATRMPFADVCGEVAALSAMVAASQREPALIVAVRGDGRGTHEIVPPCGRCRELISDFDLGTWVIVGTLEQPRKLPVASLLPLKAW